MGYSINVLEQNIAKYGEVNESIRNVIKDVAEYNGVFLDPIYNAKSFLRMMEFLENEDRINSVLYINTGGSPNLFI